MRFITRGTTLPPALMLRRSPPLSAAVQQNLGLKLEKHKGPMEMLVVDSIAKKPTEN